ncbi:MAG: CCA tRNA nucleotidyltransferase [Actinomycetota bacterium]
MTASDAESSAGSPAEFDGLPAVLTVVTDLAEAFIAAGHRLYLVGGVVRDLALGAHDAGHDIDLTTDAEPAVTKRLVKPRATALWTQGERFGTIGATVNGRDLEITTHRAEAYDHDSRNPVVAYGTSIDDDLCRRDFTINATAVSVPDGALVDPFDGLGDLERRRLVTPLSPEESFADDPLRILRAARFIPRFDLTVDPDLERAATDGAERLSIVSVERIQGELERLLALPAPAAGLDFLLRTGVLGHAVLAFGATAPAGASLGAEGVAVASTAATAPARRAGLLLGLGVDTATDELHRLRYSRADTTATRALIAHHSTAVDPAPSAADVRRVAERLGAAGLGVLDDLRALTAATHPGADLAFWARHDELAATEDLDDWTVPVSGRHIIEHLGLTPGPAVGKATNHLRELRFEHGPLTEAQALAALDAWVDETDVTDENAARQERSGPKG